MFTWRKEVSVDVDLLLHLGEYLIFLVQLKYLVEPNDQISRVFVRHHLLKLKEASTSHMLVVNLSKSAAPPRLIFIIKHHLLFLEQGHSLSP